MSFTIWTPLAVSSEAFAWRGQAWRMVESQHIAATMKLVDNRDEQDLLESLLESSKPRQPDDTADLDSVSVSTRSPAIMVSGFADASGLCQTQAARRDPDLVPGRITA